MPELIAPYSAPPALVLEDVRKSFGPTLALKSVSMEVAAGSVHALVGENGAGKSTALGILAGRIPPSSGCVKVFGEELKYGDPRASKRAGITAIYQELTIVPALSAQANVFLGQVLSRRGVLAERQMRRRYEELCERVGVGVVDARIPAGELSVADQQVLEILRALVSDARIILFDEPTASLAISEREALYKMIRGLKQSGVTIVFVSHNLDEVLDLGDEVTVFRDGRMEISEDSAHFTKPILVRAMIGKAGESRLIGEMLDEDEAVAAEPVVQPVHPKPNRSAVPTLAVTGVTVPGAIDDLELEVRAGEIVGVGGLVGSGRSTLLRAVAGIEPSSKGRMFIDGREVPWPRTVRQSLKYGIALVPEDRKGQGLVPRMSAADNIAMSNFARAGKGRVLSAKSVERATSEIAASFGFQEGRIRHHASQLSGGNQQKLLLARWKYVTPRVLLADEPTRGIDVGAKAEILHSLEEMAMNGLGLVIVSSELEEVAVVADRVFVLAEGLAAGTLDGAAGDISASDILSLAFKSHEPA